MTTQEAFTAIGLYYYDTLSQLPDQNQYLVNIGASDGITIDILYHSYMHGYGGLAIEPDAKKCGAFQVNIPHVPILCTFATPDNILDLFAQHNVPKDPDAIDIDIDGYDYWVARKILEQYEPKILSMEINYRFPPNIDFSVLYTPNYTWDGLRQFGCSLRFAARLCADFDYSLLAFEYCELFLIHNKYKHLFQVHTDLDELYRSGYYDKPDKGKVFPWDRDYDPFSLSVTEHVAKKANIEAGGLQCILRAAGEPVTADQPAMVNLESSH